MESFKSLFFIGIAAENQAQTNETNAWYQDRRCPIYFKPPISLSPDSVLANLPAVLQELCCSGS